MKTLVEQLCEAAERAGGPLSAVEAHDWLSRTSSRDVAQGLYFMTLAAIEVGLDRSVIFDKLAAMIDDIRAGERLRAKRES